MFNKSICKSITGIVVTAFIGLNGSVFAATDGTVGTSSSGTTDITLTIPDLIKVSGMTDIALGTWSGSGAKTGSDSICVYDNSGGLYNATFTGNGTASAFTIVNGGNIIPYTVTYDDGAGVDAVTKGVPLGCAGAHQTSFTCGGGTNGTIAISIAEADMAAKVAAVYSGTLTILVAPL